MGLFFKNTKKWLHQFHIVHAFGYTTYTAYRAWRAEKGVLMFNILTQLPQCWVNFTSIYDGDKTSALQSGVRKVDSADSGAIGQNAFCQTN